jgi:hypothetical protein
MTRVVLHIGTEKTGTTSIQHFLTHNRQNLLQHNIVYPVLGQRKDAHFELVNEIHPLDNNGRYMEFLPQPQHETGFIWQKLKECLDRHSDKTIVLSAEHFSSRLREKGLSYMKAFFDENNIRPEIIVFLRPQGEYIESSYSTFIKAGGTKTFSQASDNYQAQTLRYDYKHLLDLWSAFFSKENIKVIPYQKSEGDVREQILYHLNVTDFSTFNFDQSKAMNEKWGKDMLELARLVNTKYTDVPVPEKKAFLDKCALLLPSKADEKLMTSAQQMEVSTFFENSNRLVAQEYLGRDRLFANSALNPDNDTQHPVLTKLTLIDALYQTLNDQSSSI